MRNVAELLSLKQILTKPILFRIHLKDFNRPILLGKKKTVEFHCLNIYVKFDKRNT